MAMKERLQPRASPVSTYTSWLSGSVSGLSVAVLLQPLDVVRTEMQKHEHRGKLTTRMAFAKVSLYLSAALSFPQLDRVS